MTAGASRELEGRVALVTGGSGGLGSAACRGLAAAGAAVAVHYSSDRAGADAVVEAIVADGGRAIALQADVAEARDVARLLEELAAFAGAERLDVLYNNAGIFPVSPFEEITPEAWDRVMAVNVRGPFLCSQTALPLLAASGRGRIVNISSNTVFRGVPRTLHYVTSKSALIGFTRSLAREVADRGITVNCVVPSLVPTDSALETFGPSFDHVVAQQAIHRLQRPEDLADLVVFLASDRGAFITGQTINCDGGYVLR